MNILIVDDHPLTIEGYTKAIENVFTNCNVTLAYDCREAYSEISKVKSGQNFDIALIDMSLPEYAVQKLFSGIDIALLLRNIDPGCRIIMITAHTEYLIIYDIHKKIRPEGFTSKGELTPQNLVRIIQEVLDSEKYISPIVKDCISKIWQKDLMVDDYNRQILFYLSKGYKLKELDQVVFLAVSTIQRRVIQMKQAFDVPDDSSLVKVAIKQGFI